MTYAQRSWRSADGHNALGLLDEGSRRNRKRISVLRCVWSWRGNRTIQAPIISFTPSAGPNPELGLLSADRLLNYAPQAGHLVHMPSHIYMRVGQYHDAEMANAKAIKTDQSYIRHCRAQGFYPGLYYPHNVHFIWYARLFQGRSADTLSAAQQAAALAYDNSCGPNKAVEALRLHLPWPLGALWPLG
jgi:hypothetical protein